MEKQDTVTNLCYFYKGKFMYYFQTEREVREFGAYTCYFSIAFDSGLHAKVAYLGGAKSDSSTSIVKSNRHSASSKHICYLNYL